MKLKLGLAIPILLTSLQVKAQELSLESILELEEVTVASNVVTDAKKQPASVTTITSQQLRMSGARTLKEAIMMYTPGFFVVEDQDDVILGFRGIAPDNNSKVMLLINGTQVNTEFFWGPGQSIVSAI